MINNIIIASKSEVRKKILNENGISCEVVPANIDEDQIKESLLKEKAWDDEVDFPERLKEEVFIKHIKGPLFFGSTSDFQQLAAQIPKTASTVVIRLGRMQYMDQSGLYAMEDVLVDLRKDNINVLFVGLLRQPQYMMERIDIIPDLIPKEHIFTTFKDCLTWIKANVKDKH